MRGGYALRTGAIKRCTARVSRKPARWLLGIYLTTLLRGPLAKIATTVPCTFSLLVLLPTLIISPIIILRTSNSLWRFPRQFQATLEGASPIVACRWCSPRRAVRSFKVLSGTVAWSVEKSRKNAWQRETKGAEGGKSSGGGSVALSHGATHRSTSPRLI